MENRIILFPLLSCENTARKQPSASQEESPHQKSILPDLDLRLPASRSLSKYLVLFKPLWYFCYGSSPNRIIYRKITLEGRRGREGFSWFPWLSADLPPSSSFSLLPKPSFQGQTRGHCSEAPKAYGKVPTPLSGVSLGEGRVPTLL